jgi:hypothetical protein
VREDTYRKLHVPDGALLVAGDVVATGVTLTHALEVLFARLRQTGSTLAGLVVFTIGCHRLEHVLGRFDRQSREAFPGYRGTCAVYLEGRFRLVDRRTQLRIGLPGTDLIRRDCLLTPEFEVSQYEAPSHPLERCVVYDAGSRAFDIPAFVHDVQGYWAQTRGLAREGWTLAEALAERWRPPGCLGREPFLAACRSRWRGVDPKALEDLYDRHLERLELELADGRGEDPKALEQLCEERIASLERTLIR